MSGKLINHPNSQISEVSSNDAPIFGVNQRLKHNLMPEHEIKINDVNGTDDGDESQDNNDTGAVTQGKILFPTE